MIVKIISTPDQFVEAFEAVRPNDFRRMALVALFHHYNEYCMCVEENVEMDPVAMSCEWAEYDSKDEALEAYDGHETLESLMDETDVIVGEDFVLVKNF